MGSSSSTMGASGSSDTTLSGGTSSGRAARADRN
jgi:hypothetical protein